MNPLRSAVPRGRLCALGSAASFGAIPPLARVAYDAGGSPGVVIMGRLLVGALTAAAVVVLLRRSWRLPRREWGPTAVIALAWIGLTVGYMASFYYIPVSLAVLIFFTFPVLISLVGPLVARQRPEPLTLGAALLAFVGLALALGPDLAGLDWRGCALAALAALGATTTFLLSQRLVVEQDMFAFSFHLHWLCALLVGGTLAAIGGTKFPDTGLGTAGLLVASLFYISAVLLQFGAIRLAGPGRASVVFNAEPVITMVGAAVILGERLGSWQITGASLVIVALLVSARFDRRET